MSVYEQKSGYYFIFIIHSGLNFVIDTSLLPRYICANEVLIIKDIHFLCAKEVIIKRFMYSFIILTLLKCDNLSLHWQHSEFCFDIYKVKDIQAECLKTPHFPTC